MTKGKLFSSKIIKELKHYVYLLSDPQNNEIFYVGKGVGNRVFSHLNDSSKNDKTDKIKEIRYRGLEPKIEILVHGVEDEITIKKIESAMIDLVGKNNLTNKVGGYESTNFGRMDLNQIIGKYTSKVANIKEPVMLIKVADKFRYNMSPEQLYDYTRGIWKVSINREKAHHAFAVYDSIIQETYEIKGWFPAGSTHSKREDEESWKKTYYKRWEFVGKISETMRKKYHYKSVEHYFPPGARNPIRYINC